MDVQDRSTSCQLHSKSVKAVSVNDSAKFRQRVQAELTGPAQEQAQVRANAFSPAITTPCVCCMNVTKEVSTCAQELLEQMRNLSADVKRLRGDWTQDTLHRSWNACPAATCVDPAMVTSYRYICGTSSDCIALGAQSSEQS